MQKFVSYSLVAGFLTLTASFASADSMTCNSLSEKVRAAEERVFYARNAWLNRKDLCEADLNPQRCQEYFESDYLDSKNDLSEVRKQYRTAGCTQY